MDYIGCWEATLAIYLAYVMAIDGSSDHLDPSAGLSVQLLAIGGWLS